ncbi:hypothetical protein PI124_g14042 [Phytophthora idaei]|nr:hypothetical protein PI125_g12914 [Phytophthora idaei]KAG3147935.1 hypothetical protein PI126_g12663 [Phytophthora idaei]KAG3241087.1 hypothetical protein PI124_g14042 [Phytophthora idaei]
MFENGEDEVYFFVAILCPNKACIGGAALTMGSDEGRDLSYNTEQFFCATRTLHVMMVALFSERKDNAVE